MAIAMKMGGFYGSGGGGINENLPPMVIDFAAAAGNQKITASWKNPKSPYLSGVWVVYNDTRFPENPDDGTGVDAKLETSIVITGLENEKEYFVRAFPYNKEEQYQTLMEGSTASAKPSPGPLQVTDVKLVGDNASPVLSWKNTPDPTYSVTVAVQKEGSAPTNPADGKEIYRGTGETVTVKGLKAGIQYYFGVFSLSAEGGYRPPVVTLPYSYALPQNVTDLQVEGTGSTPTIKWNAPVSSPVYKETVVIQSVDAPVTRIEDGTEIYRGQGTSCKAVGLERLVKYYWTVFVLSTEGEYRKPVSTVEAYSYNISSVLNDNDWSVISAVAKEGKGDLYWKVGDAKETPVNGTVSEYQFSGSQYPFILGFNHNQALEGLGIHMSFGKSALIGGKDIAYHGFRMNNFETNGGGWKKSLMRTQTCKQFYDILSTDLKSVIVECTKYTDNTGGGRNNANFVTATRDKIFIMSEFETQGYQADANSHEQSKQNQYEYYRTGNSKTRYNANKISVDVCYWLRSPDTDYNTAFCYVPFARSGVTNGRATTQQGFTPCFMLGTPVGV